MWTNGATGHYVKIRDGEEKTGRGLGRRGEKKKTPTNVMRIKDRNYIGVIRVGSWKESRMRQWLAVILAGENEGSWVLTILLNGRIGFTPDYSEHHSLWDRTKQYSSFIHYCKTTIVLILDWSLRISQPHHAVKRIEMHALKKISLQIFPVFWKSIKIHIK